MKTRKHITFFLFVFSCLTLWSQDYHFSGFIPNRTFTNPATVTLPVAPEVLITYRNQWPGIPATFVTYGAAFVVPVESMKSGLGLQVLNDVQGSGVIRRTYASLLYGYHIDLGKDWQVGAGISASYVFKNFDADELVFRSDILNDLGYAYSDVVLNSYKKSYPDFGIGMVVRNSNGFTSGVSVFHITRPEESVSSQVKNRMPVKYSGFVTTKVGQFAGRGGFHVVVEPGIFYSRQAKNEELIWGMQTVISSVFVAGAWIRQNLKFDLDAVIFSAGIFTEKYNFLYSYDVNVKKINFLSTKMGAHEVTFLYRMEYKGRKAGAVDCPTYSMVLK